MQKRLQIECSTILSSTPIQSIIQATSTAPASSLLKNTTNTNNTSSDTTAASLQSRSSKQAAYIQQCTYRISAPVTAFKIHDPDPHAVDAGHVLGIRFEVMSQGHFLRPYYVMFNRPYDGSRHLRVHRHTVPPAIPLAGLAARYLPAPRADPSSSRGGGQSVQSLDRFVAALRRDIMRFHNRLGLTADLRRTVGLHRKGRAATGPNDVVEAGIADAEAKHVKLAWADGRNGRIVMGPDGVVEKFVVFDAEGRRDWRITQMLFDRRDGVEGIARKLRRYAAT